MVGSEICRLLAENDRSFRALVRETTDLAKLERLKGYGAELAKGSLLDRDSLTAACRGVETVICTVSSMPFSYQPGVNDIQTVDQDGVINLITAAKAAGVKHFILTTFSGNLDLDFPLRNAKRAAEQRLKESALSYTILRPSYFMEIWLSPAVGFDAANAKAAVYGDGDQLLSWISFKDVARFAVESVDNPAARNRTLELGGPESLSPHQVIGLFEKTTGRTFQVAHVSSEALQEQFDGATDPMQKSFICLMQCYAKGDAIDMGEIRKTFAVPLTSVQEYITGMLGKS
jgi:NADH dehydrogenase